MVLDGIPDTVELVKGQDYVYKKTYKDFLFYQKEFGLNKTVLIKQIRGKGKIVAASELPYASQPRKPGSLYLRFAVTLAEV